MVGVEQNSVIIIRVVFKDISAKQESPEVIIFFMFSQDLYELSLFELISITTVGAHVMNGPHQLVHCAVE